MRSVLTIKDYNKDFFIPKSFDDAKRIVLGHGDTETPEKWEVETNWIKDLFIEKKFIDKNSIVLDWGVGIGRLSKMLIDTFDCEVIGVDINNEMLSYAKNYIASDKFTGILSDDLHKLDKKCTQVIAVWALQHSVFINEDIKKIYNATVDNSKMFIFENNIPVIPVKNPYKPWLHLLPNIEDKDKTTSIYFSKYLEHFDLIEKGKFPKKLNIEENIPSWYGFFTKNSFKSVFIPIRQESF